MPAQAPRTLFDKIWDAHVVDTLPDGTALLYIDLHLTHEVTTPQAFEGLRAAGRKVRRPDATLAVVDHNIATDASRRTGISDAESRLQVETLERNVVEFGVPYIPLLDDAAGHRPHHRAGARPLAARHDHRLRRQPHLDARRHGRARLRHRHLRGRARAGDADAAAEAGEEHAGQRGRQPRPRLLRPRTSCWRSSARSAPPAAPATSSSTPATRSARSTWPGA